MCVGVCIFIYGAHVNEVPLVMVAMSTKFTANNNNSNVCCLGYCCRRLHGITANVSVVERRLPQFPSEFLWKKNKQQKHNSVKNE